MNGTPVRLTDEAITKLDGLAALAGLPDRGRGRAGRTPAIVWALLDLADAHPAEIKRMLNKRLNPEPNGQA